MKRTTLLLLALLALVLAACGGAPAAESAPASESAPTAEPTAEPTVEPVESEEAAASADAGGSDTALADLLPDTVGGQGRTDFDASDSPMFAQILGQSGADAGEVEFLFSSYGEGVDAVAVTAMRIPDMGEVELRALAQMMAGYADAEADIETVTMGGKTVLVLGASDVPERAYLYFAEGAMFIVGGGTEELVVELLGQLP